MRSEGRGVRSEERESAVKVNLERLWSPYSLLPTPYSPLPTPFTLAAIPLLAHPKYADEDDPLSAHHLRQC